MFVNLENSVKLYYEEYGSKNNDVILFIHGNEEDHHIFDQYIEPLKDRYRLILVDSRCHGESSKAPLHYENMKDDMILFLKELNINKCHIIGYSDGGIIALMLSMGTNLVDKCFSISPNIFPSGLKDECLDKYRPFKEDPYKRLMLEEPNIDPSSLSNIKNRVILISSEFDVVKDEHTKLINDSIKNCYHYLIKGCDHSSVTKASTELLSIINLELSLDVYFEDNHVIVVDKKAGVLSQEDDTKEPDILSITKDYLKIKYNKPGSVYLSLIQRLDRNVSGLMVLSKTTKATTRLNSIRPVKHYYAVVYGILDKKEDTLVDYLLKDEKKLVAYSDKSGKEAILKYKVIEEKNNFSLLDVEIETGRFHQIRFQLSKLGHSIYNDSKYNPNIEKNGYDLGLDAYMVSFIHPISKEEIVIKRNPKGTIFKLFNVLNK